jgi:hypothetical protein
VNFGWKGNHFPWKTWIDVAIQHKLCITDWPNDIPCPGEDFEVHDLSPTQNQRVLESVNMKKWVESMYNYLRGYWLCSPDLEIWQAT